MRKSIKLFFLFFMTNWMQETEFRTNLIVNSLMSIGWALSFLLFTQIIFGHVNSIGGWTKPEVMLLVVTQTLSWGLLTISVLPGMDGLSVKIKQGSLDQLLTKPISLRYLLAVSNQNIDGIARIPVLTATAILLSRNLNTVPSLLTFLLYLVMVVLGAFILYNVFFIIHTTVFWLVDLSNIGHLNNIIADTAQIPPEAFNIKARIFLGYLIPTVFIAAFPTRVLLGQPILPVLLLTILVAFVTFFLSQWFWNFALRHYSSASS